MNKRGKPCGRELEEHRGPFFYVDRRSTGEACEEHKKAMKTGTRVRMTEEFKRNARGQCQGPGKHVGHGPSWIPDPEMPDDGCAACSWTHVEEFGECEGLVEDLMFPDDPTSEFVNVRWQPSGLRYGYHPNSLEVVQ